MWSLEPRIVPHRSPYGNFVVAEPYPDLNWLELVYVCPCTCHSTNNCMPGIHFWFSELRCKRLGFRAFQFWALIISEHSLTDGQIYRIHRAFEKFYFYKYLLFFSPKITVFHSCRKVEKVKQQQTSKPKEQYKNIKGIATTCKIHVRCVVSCMNELHLSSVATIIIENVHLTFHEMVAVNDAGLVQRTASIFYVYTLLRMCVCLYTYVRTPMYQHTFTRVNVHDVFIWHLNCDWYYKYTVTNIRECVCAPHSPCVCVYLFCLFI